MTTTFPISTRTATAPSLRDRPRAPWLSRRRLGIALGLVWLLDGLLQLQPFMFTRGFAQQIIAPAAAGQPPFVSRAVLWNAHLVAAHPALLDSGFAAIQLLLGVGFLFRRTVRPTIVASVAWALGVWYLGEGLGGLSSGQTLGLVGAPGAALLYAVLAVAAWPPNTETWDSGSVRDHDLPAQWLVGAWAVLWTLFGVLSLLHIDNVTSVPATLRANAGTVPAWLADIDHHLAWGAHAAGGGTVLLMASVELAVGLLSLAGRRFRYVAIWTGVGLAVVYWFVGQSCGLLFSGQATDPDAGPLVVLLGLVTISALRSIARTCSTASPDLAESARIGR